MATLLIPGQQRWAMTRNSAGQREYRIKHLVVSGILDGPANVLQTPGLPLPGATWIVDDDVDVFAWCRQDAEVTPLITNEPNRFWEVEQVFGTQPILRCGDVQVEDPLLEPQEISGGFRRYTEEATTDRYGEPVFNSAHEQIRGPQVEFPYSNPTVSITQNVANLELDLLIAFINTVNSVPLWGVAARSILVQDITWEKKYHQQCQVYYTRRFSFEIKFGTWDRILLDEGTKVLHGHWNPDGNWALDQIDGADPDPDNPQHFDRFKDKNGENARVILNGAGLPAGVNVGTSPGTPSGNPGEIVLEKYDEGDLLLLGIPATF